MLRLVWKAGYRQLLWFIVLLLLTPLSQADNHPFSDSVSFSASGKTKVSTAPVVINGSVLFDVVGIPSFPARQRASQLADKIEAIAENPDIPADSIHHQKEGERYEIMQGNTRLMSVFSFDAAYLGLNNSIEPVARSYVFQLREAIKAYRLDRTPERLKENLIKAALRTLGLVASLLAILWLFRGINYLLEKYFKRQIKKLEAKSMRVIQAKQIWRVVRNAMHLLKIVMILGVIYFFLNFVLSLFPWTRFIAQNLLDLVIEPLQAMGLGFVDYLPSLFFLIILFLLTRYLLRLMKSLFEAIHLQNIRFRNFEAEWAWPTYRIVRIIVILFAVVIAYPYIPGSSSDAFKGVSLFMGVLLSLGSTSVISNIIAGYTMTYRRAFRVGDRVRIGETVGEVTDVRLLVTHVRSLKNETVVIPNSTILNSEITNYSEQSHKQGLILHTRVGIGYEVPWRQVEAMLMEAAARTRGLLKAPEPFVLQPALTDFAVTYELNAYFKDASKMVPLYSELHRNIQDVFNEYGVQIMTPNYVADTPDPKMVAVENWYTPPASKPGQQES